MRSNPAAPLTQHHQVTRAPPALHLASAAVRPAAGLAAPRRGPIRVEPPRLLPPQREASLRHGRSAPKLRRQPRRKRSRPARTMPLRPHRAGPVPPHLHSPPTNRRNLRRPRQPPRLPRPDGSPPPHLLRPLPPKTRPSSPPSFPLLNKGSEPVRSTHRGTHRRPRGLR